MGWLLALLVACATRRVGVVEVAGARVELRTLEGPSRLLVAGDAARLRGLGGYLVEVRGVAAGGPLRVTAWEALEGPGGLPVFVGPVQVLGLQVGVQDAASGSLVLVDEAAAARLRPLAGGWVALEGFVEGPQRVRVVGWRSLD